MKRISNEWKDYECIDAGNGEKLERWGNVYLRRPDPQIIWNKSNDKVWNSFQCSAEAVQETPPE